MGATKKKAASKASPARTREEAPPRRGPIVSFVDAETWGDWLASHHGSSRGVWLKIAKKGAGRSSVTYAEAVERSLAWGWIDGQKGKLDETSWLQRFTPRGPRSIWSKINREKALALIAGGRMKPPGLAEVERARRDGRWEAAYESQSRATVPPDLAAALEANPRAARFLRGRSGRPIRCTLCSSRIHTAKKPETRAKRIETFVAMLGRHEKLHP